VLSVRGLVKTFLPGRRGERTVAVDGLSLDVEAGQLFTLLGPSGCGKTTTLRCVAGLDRPDSGEIAVAGRLLYSSRRGVAVPANERGLGMVFQSYGIWPHMNVFDTVAFPLTVMPRSARPGSREIRARVEQTLAVVRLQGLGERRATELSGGQQQRLALARALVTEPPLLLMDEPLSNLDARLRDDMRLELKRLQRDLGLTALYVTHDQAEALAMSSVVAVMRDGNIEQVGKPREIYERPGSRFVAEFLGNANLIEGVIQGTDAGVYSISTSNGTVRVRSQGRFAAGDRVVVSVHSERLVLEPQATGDSRPNRWRGTVQARAFRGDSIEHVVKVGSAEMRARCEPSISIPPGTDVAVTLPEDGCSLVASPR
jgi:iron(III) transport system ATP-binding protein